MAVQFLNILSNSTIFTGNGTVTPEQLSEVAALLPAFAFPFLPPAHSHGPVLWASSLNGASYIINYMFWASAESYVHLPYWAITVTILSFILGLAACTRSRYRDIKPEDVSWSGHLVCCLITIHLVKLGGYFITFEHLLTWKNIALTLIGCTTIVMVVPAIFFFISPPFSVFFSRLIARRLRWVFWIHRSDIKANTEDKAVGYSQVDSQCDSDDDTIYEFTGVKIVSTKDDIGNEGDDVANQGIESDGKPNIQQDAEQYAGQATEQDAGQDAEHDAKHEIQTEDPPGFSGLLVIFVCISAPALLSSSIWA